MLLGPRRDVPDLLPVLAQHLGLVSYELGHLATPASSVQPASTPACSKKQVPPALEVKLGSTQVTVLPLVDVAAPTGVTVDGVVAGSGQQRPLSSGR
jgi:hypothetical protein